MQNSVRKALLLILVLSLALPVSFFGPPTVVSAADQVVDFTILHTNDFHGNLQPAGSNPGAARVAQYIVNVRAEVGDENVLLLDGGDMMQGSLLSNLQKGEPAIAYYREIGYDAVTFGNHEFDWGQQTLLDRAAQAIDPLAGGHPFPMLAANIVKKGASGSCDGWEEPDFADPYAVLQAGPAGSEVKIGVIGVSSVETPYITIASATEGLCFKDPAQSILHYYDELAEQSDVLVVLSHNGLEDGGYGYGFPVYGDKTLADKLNEAGKPADLIIGGHSHTNLSAPEMVGTTTIVQAHYAGRKLGRANISFNKTTGEVAVTWSRYEILNTDPEYAPVQALVDGYASDPAYVEKISEEIGWSQVDLVRNYNGDSLMGAFIQDAIYGGLNEDGSPANDVDMVFNNPGGIRADLCKADPCVEGLLAEPYLLNYGMMFSVLPFGNATVVGEMSGAQIMELLNQSASLFKGAIQVAGVRYKFFSYTDANPGPQPWAWGAYDVQVLNQDSGEYEALDLSKTYRVATNEFLAPAGQDGFVAFKYMQNISYWGDMLDTVNAWVKATYTAANPYKGPLGDGELDGRITRNGDDAGGDIIPVTVLHHNDSHGRLLPSGSYAGYTQLATLIKQERAHNPDRTVLLNAGDSFQGDSMMYYFKSAGLGYSADGEALPEDQQINPLLKAMNAMGYTAMVLGNHEFNFGKEVFGTLEQATFPILQANIADDGAYGLAEVGVQPFISTTLGTEGIRVGILGIGNHRVPNYELPSNIPGLTFTNPITTGLELAPDLAAENDVVIALTHIGFTTNPNSVEVDNNVDTVFAAEVPGVDVLVGGHSHTDPTRAVSGSAYQYLPTFVAGPDGTPVLIGHANRYNTMLGQIVIGLMPDGEGGYKVVSRAGRAITVDTKEESKTPEDTEIKNLAVPYDNLLKAYNNTEIGQTLSPIDTREAFTQETNGANLQADAAVWKLTGEGVTVDVHLSGAMTNRLIAETATEASPYTLTVADMFSAMPYENSLLVLKMNGPQIKQVLERAYRNYYYYTYIPDYGGYSHYTTCMIDTDAVGEITYVDTYPLLPSGSNVASLKINGKPVDFKDAETFYNVSTVNYLAAGSCNFNDDGETLWPLDQIVADTQYYVRDAVIEYVQAQTEPINPQVEGRLNFIELVNTIFMPTIWQDAVE